MRESHAPSAYPLQVRHRDIPGGYTFAFRDGMGILKDCWKAAKVSYGPLLVHTQWNIAAKHQKCVTAGESIRWTVHPALCESKEERQSA